MCHSPTMTRGADRSARRHAAETRVLSTFLGCRGRARRYVPLVGLRGTVGALLGSTNETILPGALEVNAMDRRDRK